MAKELCNVLLYLKSIKVYIYCEKYVGLVMSDEEEVGYGLGFCLFLFSGWGGESQWVRHRRAGK